MFRRRPQLPVRPEQQEWIEESFRLLTQLFGDDYVQNAPLVLPSDQFFPRKWEATEDWARYAFERVCELMHVAPDRVDLEFEFDAWEDLRQSGVHVGRTRGAAGMYSKKQTDEGPSRARIIVKASLTNQPEVMVAVMAHELAHVLLLGDNRIPSDTEKMEPLTDLTTVFCGFGTFTANSAHVRKVDSRGLVEMSHGYLTQREYGYSLALFAWLRGETDPSWSRELTVNVRGFLRETLAIFKSSGRQPRA